MRYAQKTMVSTDRSKAEIEGMLTRYGASQFVSGWQGTRAAIGFEASGRKIRFELPLPDKSDKRLYLTPTGRTKKVSEEKMNIRTTIILLLIISSLRFLPTRWAISQLIFWQSNKK